MGRRQPFRVDRRRDTLPISRSRIESWADEERTVASVMPELSLDQQVDAIEKYLGRQIPAPVRRLYLPGTPTSARLLPLATVRELEPPYATGSTTEQFLDAQARFRSALGHVIGDVNLAASDDEHVWPSGLLTVFDLGCAIYQAIDLDSPALRVIEYEHFDPVDDPVAAAGNRTLAYSEPTVP